MIILDTQPISHLQWGASEAMARLMSRIQKFSEDEVRITIISPYEQTRSCIGDIHANNTNPDAQLSDYSRLVRLLEFYAGWRGRILPFDAAASVLFKAFSPKLRRDIGPMDSRIAAIALSHGGRSCRQISAISWQSPDCMSRTGSDIDLPSTRANLDASRSRSSAPWRVHDYTYTFPSTRRIDNHGIHDPEGRGGRRTQPRPAAHSRRGDPVPHDRQRPAPLRRAGEGVESSLASSPT